MITVEISRSDEGNLVVHWSDPAIMSNDLGPTQVYPYPPNGFDVETVGGSIDGLRITPHCPDRPMPLSAWGILCFMLGMILLECWR